MWKKLDFLEEGGSLGACSPLCLIGDSRTPPSPAHKGACSCFHLPPKLWCPEQAPSPVCRSSSAPHRSPWCWQGHPKSQPSLSEALLRGGPRPRGTSCTLKAGHSQRHVLPSRSLWPAPLGPPFLPETLQHRTSSGFHSPTPLSGQLSSTPREPSASPYCDPCLVPRTCHAQAFSSPAAPTHPSQPPGFQAPSSHAGFL